ncbi:MAG: redox-sensing transcriptional repressor Rex [Clostridiaceae bacterium]|jgi:redox-sensing transcriptional repressor|nr:redox-sensing transcriptional repressor Rex [Clostridiaceae bacterium]
MSKNSENVIEKKEKPYISIQSLQRMPYYLQYLKQARDHGIDVIPATTIAADLKLNEVQVRKDLAAICTTKGKPKAGFIVDELINNMEDFLGYNNTKDAVLVGAGSLGKALLSYSKFENYGLNIVAAFDIDKDKIGKKVNGKEILPMEELENTCKPLNIHIGIITVPVQCAQEVCDKLIECGILAIWNFAPIHLLTPENILVKNENMATSLAVLSQHLQEKIDNSRESLKDI